jgi:adenylate cyclase
LQWLFRMRGVKQPPDQVVVIAIDRHSAAELDLPSKPSAWPRSLHARLIEGLVKAGAEVIVFDLSFETVSAPGEDQALAAAMRQAGNVVLVDALREETVPLPDKTGGSRKELRIEKQIPPIPLLEDAAVAHAAFPLPKASRVNAYWTFKASAGDSPALPVVAFQVYGLRVYEKFLALLQETMPARAVKLPASRDAVIASHAIPELMLTLRSTLLNEPELAQQMRKALQSTDDRTLDPGEKRVLGSLLSLYSAGETRYLNYYGPPRTIPTVAYSRAQQSLTTENDASAANEFAGKAVFIGFSAATQPEQDRTRDDYRTVFSQSDGLDLSGVEIAATAFANLLEDRPVRPLAHLDRAALIFVWGLVLGGVCRSVRIVFAATFFVLLSGAYLLVARHQFDVAGVWLPLVIPLCVQAPLVLFGGVLLQYREARREREHIKQVFGKFIPRSVVNRLAQEIGPITSADQLVFGVCLATDVEQFTALAERMKNDPRGLSVLMNDYFAELFAPVERHGGIVYQVKGDAMIAIWANSSSDKSLRVAACRASLEIAAAMKHADQGRSQPPALPTRIGLHSGQILLATVGARSHYEYSPVGDMVNTASRLEGLGKYLGARLLTSADVLEGLTGFLARPLGAFFLKGKSEPVRVFELLGSDPEIGREQRWLCSEFADALNAYRERDWRAAIERFSNILDAFPEDGPARFYLQRCEAYVASPPVGKWDPTVCMEGNITVRLGSYSP